MNIDSFAFQGVHNYGFIAVRVSAIAKVPPPSQINFEGCLEVRRGQENEGTHLSRKIYGLQLCCDTVETLRNSVERSETYALILDK